MVKLLSDRLRRHLRDLRSRILVNLTLTLRYPLHIGAIQPIREPVLPLYKIRLSPSLGGKAVPLIPATSLKGALRAISERMALSNVKAYAANRLNLAALCLHYEPEEGVLSHRGEAKSEVCEGRRRLREWFEELIKELNIRKLLSLKELRGVALRLGMKEEDVNELLAKGISVDNEALLDFLDRSLALYCPICVLYGSPSLVGKLRLVDCLPTDELSLSFRTHVGISRDTLTSKEGALYEEELIDPGVNFKTELIVDNLDLGSPEAKLLGATLDYILKLGLHLGGGKSRGLGVVEVDEGSSKAWMIDYTQLNMEDRVKLLANPKDPKKALRLKEFIDKLLTTIQ